MRKIAFDKNFKIGILLFLVFFSTFLYFSAPTVWWGDNAEYATMPYLSGVLHPPGYNIYLFVGKIFSFIPIGDIGFRGNLMSVFFGALTVPLLFLLIYELTKNRFSSVIGSLFFGFSFTFWSQAILPEVHTFNMFFVVVLLFIIFEWEKYRKKEYLYIFTLLYSLSLSAHITNILFFPAFLYFIFVQDFKTFKKKLHILIILFLIGLTPFLWTAISVNNFTPPPMATNYFGSTVFPNTTENFIRYVTVSEFNPLKPGFGISDLVARWFSYTKIIQGNFAVIGVIIGIIGIWELFKERRKTAIMLILMYLGNLLYFLNHPASQMFSLYMSSFLIFSIWIGLGVRKLHKEIKFPKATFTKLISIIIIGLLLFLIPIYGSKYPSIGFAPIDLRGDNQTTVFAEKVFGVVDSDSIIMTSWHEYAVLYYYQKVYDVRNDILLYDFENEKDIMKFMSRQDFSRKIYYTSKEVTKLGIDNFTESYDLKQVFRLDFPSTGDYRILYEVLKK